jgi:hypothetical protein
MRNRFSRERFSAICGLRITHYSFLFYDRRSGGRNDDFRRGVHPLGLAGFNNLRADGVRVACVNKRNGASPSRPRN